MAWMLEWYHYPLWFIFHHARGTDNGLHCCEQTPEHALGACSWSQTTEQGWSNVAGCLYFVPCIGIPESDINFGCWSSGAYSTFPTGKMQTHTLYLGRGLSFSHLTAHTKNSHRINSWDGKTCECCVLKVGHRVKDTLKWGLGYSGSAGKMRESIKSAGKFTHNYVGPILSAHHPEQHSSGPCAFLLSFQWEWF